MKRYLILLAAVATQICLGATYSWAAFVGPIKSALGLGQGTVQLPFNTFYVVFPATAIAGGMLLYRLGPRFCAIAGGLLFGAGWFTASFGQTHFGFTVAGIGVLAGIGAGLAYLVPIATAIHWFPEHKGLVTGIAVAGFGGGAAAVARIGNSLMTNRGATPFEAFRLFAIAFLIIIPLAGFVMVWPASPASARTQRIRPAELLRNGVFWVLYFAMFSGLAAGFAVIANVKELGGSAVAKAGVSAVAWFAIANAAGRILWGLIQDRIPPRWVLAANLALQALLLALCGPLLEAKHLDFVAAVAGFNYGGVLVLYAISATRLWGAERMATAYGWLFSANIPASFAPTLSGFAYDRWGNFSLPLCAIAVLMVVAAILVLRCERHSGSQQNGFRSLQAGKSHDVRSN